MIQNKKPGLFYGYIIVAATFGIMLVGIGAWASFGVFFKPVLVEFAWTRAITSGAYSLEMLVAGVASVFTGRLNDRFGPRLMLTASGLFIGLGFLLMSQISGIWQLYLFYGIMVGIGFSCLMVPLLSTVARWFSRRRSLMTGIVGAGNGSGTIVLPILAGWLISTYDWRTSFTVLGIISLVVIVLFAQVLRRDPEKMGLLPDGDASPQYGNSNIEVSGIYFRDAIHTRQFWMLLLTFFCVGLSVVAIMAHIVIHATGLGFVATKAVNILAIAGGTNMAGRIIIGSTADRIGNKPTFIIGVIILLAALVWLQFSNELWMLYIFGAVFGFAWGGTLVLQSPMAADLFGLSAHGALVGLIQAGLSFGGTAGPVLLGYIFDVTGSYQLGFSILAMASLIGLILAPLLKLISSAGRRNNSI